MHFRKIAATQFDAARVTLMVMRDGAGRVVGRVMTLALNEQGEPEIMAIDDPDPPLAVAVDLAKDIAAFKEQDVDVLDAAGLWPADLTPLDQA